MWCTCVHRLLQTQEKLFVENVKVSVNLNKGLQKYFEFSQCFYFGIQVEVKTVNSNMFFAFAIGAWGQYVLLVHAAKGAALSMPLTPKPEQSKRLDYHIYVFCCCCFFVYFLSVFFSIFYRIILEKMSVSRPSWPSCR